MAAKKSRKSKSTPSKEDVVLADVPPPTSSTKKKKKKTKQTTSAASANEANSEKKKKKQQKVVEEPEPEESSESEDDDMKLTLEALDDISDESDEEQQGDDDDDGEEETDEAVDEATARLRQMIQEGKFDGLLKQSKKKKKQQGKKEEEEEDLEEDELDVSMNEDDDDDDNEEEEVEVKNDKNDSENESEEEDAENEQSSKQTTQAIALVAALEGTDRHLPWPETFTVVPPTPLPFGPVDGGDEDVGGKKRKRSTDASYDDDEEEEEYVDVHDDLKREVAFYDNAMEAVRIARNHCENAGIPFTRPEDFFAEMIKSDDHMAKIKDRLIFETKKIEAVERRKSNKEQTVMAKERAAHRIAEKSKAKKAHMSAVEDWKKSAEQGRGRLGGRVQDMDADEDQLRGLGGGGGPNKKRMAADKRYGFGGKRGRFKQNDAKDLNDMSGFKVRGSFAGGQKISNNAYGKGKKGGGGGGSRRPGKRARDARRK